jgi:hypothetical protein
MTRNGKIARLPLAIRQQLNQRLQNGELAQDLLSWLTGCRKSGPRETAAHPANHGHRREAGPATAPESLLTAATRT